MDAVVVTQLSRFWKHLDRLHTGIAARFEPRSEGEPCQKADN